MSRSEEAVPMILKNVELLNRLRHQALVAAGIVGLVVISPLFSALPDILVIGLCCWLAFVLARLASACVRFLIIQHAMMRQGTDKHTWAQFAFPPDRKSAERAFYSQDERGHLILGFAAPDGDPLWVTDSEFRKNILVSGGQGRAAVIEGVVLQHLLKTKGGLVFLDDNTNSSATTLAVISGLVGRADEMKIFGADKLQYDPFLTKQPPISIARKIADSVDILLSPQEIEALVTCINIVDSAGLAWRLSDVIWLLEEGLSDRNDDVLSIFPATNPTSTGRVADLKNTFQGTIGLERLKEILGALKRVERGLASFNLHAVGRPIASIQDALKDGSLVYLPFIGDEELRRTIQKIVLADLESAVLDAAIKKTGHGLTMIAINSPEIKPSERLVEAASKGRAVIIVGSSQASSEDEVGFGTVIRLGEDTQPAVFLDTSSRMTREGAVVYFETDVNELWNADDLVPSVGVEVSEFLQLKERAVQARKEPVGKAEQSAIGSKG